MNTFVEKAKSLWSKIHDALFAKKASLDAKKARAGYVFVLPFLLGIVVIYLPILIDSIWFSFNKLGLEWNSELGRNVMKLDPMGFKYYTAALLENSTFASTLLSGIQQLIFEVPAVIIFSLFIAVVLNQKMLGRAAFRAIFFVPVIISTGFMETILADNTASDYMEGGTNMGGGQSNGSEIISMLDVQQLFANMKVGTELVGYVVSIVNNVYQYINYSGVQMLIFLAGLQSISPSIYEASQIEGATGWETFWKITFPMISPMILVNAIYSAINAFTRSSNSTMRYIEGKSQQVPLMAASSWIYFAVVMLIIAVVAGLLSTFIFYQRRD